MIFHSQVGSHLLRTWRYALDGRHATCIPITSHIPEIFTSILECNIFGASFLMCNTFEWINIPMANVFPLFDQRMKHSERFLNLAFPFHFIHLIVLIKISINRINFHCVNCLSHDRKSDIIWYKVTFLNSWR